MNIIDSIDRINRQLKILSIDPQLDRSTELENSDLIAENLYSIDPRIDSPTPDTEGCRACPEGLDW
jgi:hypothetical protein